MNHTLDLHGLREDLARDFLATIGLLRLLDLKWPLLNPKLCWLHETGHPRIQLNETLPSNWCHQLVADIQSLEADALSPLFHGEIIKAEYKTFRDAVHKAVLFAKSSHPLAALPELMFASYGGQMSDPKTGLIETTMLSFANGQSGKSLLRDARELIRSLNGDEMHNALAGRGKPVPGKSFRWTPQEYRPAAHRAHDPGTKVKGDESLDYPAFNILAFIGMSCVPTCDIGEDCFSAAFHRDVQGWFFQWPVWSAPLGVEETSALIGTSAAAAVPDVIRLWKSRRLVAEKSVYFAPATIA